MKRLSVLVAVVLVVLMVHARGGSAEGVSPLASCTADCTGLDSVFIADPFNCTSYYACLDGEAFGPFDCGSGNYFDPETGDCATLGGGECQAVCGAANCPLYCNGTVDAIGSAFNCSVYYYCTPTGPSEPKPCPDGSPYYNGNTFSCTSDPSVCCSGYCTAYCYGSGFYLTPDPNSCNGFYLCTEEGEVDETRYDTCDAGQVFNVGLGNCVADTGEPCVTLCDTVGGNGGGGTSSTTTTTTTTTTTSTTTTSGGGGGGSTDVNGCVSSLVCTAEGDFPACSTCQPDYFVCSGPGATGVPGSCEDGYVFNTNPDYPYCVLSSHCPTG